MKRIIAFIFITLVFIPLSTYAIKIDPSITFDGVGNEKVRKCPSFDCETIKYGGYSTFFEIIESSGDWYKVHCIERSSSYANRNNPLIPYQEYIPIELPRSQWTTTTGWVYYSVIPDKVLLKLPEGSLKLRKGEVIGVTVLKKQGKIFNCPSSSNCTFLDTLDASTSVEVLDIDETGKWYKIKSDNPVLLDWDKWVRASDFVGKPVKTVDKINTTILTSTSSPVVSKKEDSYLDRAYNYIEILAGGVVRFIKIWSPFK